MANMKAQAFRLFDEGFDKNSPEVKALGMKAGTRWGYYAKWQQGGSAKEAIHPLKETIQPLAETPLASTPLASTPLASTAESEERGGKVIPVLGQGLTMTITISVKTLALYQIAASRLGGELTMGDFVDGCVELMHRDRGLDLGLINIRGGDHAG